MASLHFAPRSVSLGLQKPHEEKVQLAQLLPPLASACSEARSVPTAATFGRGPVKLFRQATMEKSTKSLATGQGGVKDLQQGSTPQTPSSLNHMLFFPLQCN